MSELMSELRVKGISSLSEVEYAIVEDNGKLSVFRKESSSPVTAQQLGIPVKPRGIAHCVVVEGEYFDDGIRIVGHDREWVNGKLKEKCAAVKDVCIMTVDDGGGIIIIMKGTDK